MISIKVDRRRGSKYARCRAKVCCKGKQDLAAELTAVLGTVDKLIAQNDLGLTAEQLLDVARQAKTNGGVNELGEEDAPVVAEEDDFEPELPKEPRTKRGQLWQLGRHRLLCGDATSAEDVQLLVGGGTDRPPSYRPAV